MGGYHDSCGEASLSTVGDAQYCGGISLSTVGDVQYCGENIVQARTRGLNLVDHSFLWGFSYS